MRKWVIIFWVCAWVLPALAQPTPRDYGVSVPSAGYTFNADQTQFTLEIIITNRGGDALAPTEINIIAPDKRVLNASDDNNVLPPLAQGESVQLQFPFSSRDFPPGSTQVFTIEAGIDLYELAGTAIAADNTLRISVPIPDNLPPAEAPASADSAASASDPLAGLAAVIEGLRMPQVAFVGDGAIVLDDTRYELPQVLLGAAIVIVTAILLWLVLTLLRLLFRRPQRFPIWQPAYAMMPTMDPNSTIGRRQGWQQHAQNGTILAAPTEGNLHPIKLLLDTPGAYMAGWRIVGVRLSQYDSYGRVGRSETVAERRLIRRLNHVLSRRDQLTEDRLLRRLRPITRQLVKQFRAKIGKRSLYLPVALDVRFEARAGEARIVFELYQCAQQAWHRLDRWEPTMAIVGSKLLENYTYTVHGMSGGERPREFFGRLPEDVEWLLGEVIRSRGIVSPEAPSPQTYNIPDTLSGLQPVGGDYQLPA